MLAEIKDEHFQKYITLIAREIQNLVNIHNYLGTKKKNARPAFPRFFLWNYSIYTYIYQQSADFLIIWEKQEIWEKIKQPKKFDLIKPDDKTQGQKNITPKYKVIH